MRKNILIFLLVSCFTTKAQLKELKLNTYTFPEIEQLQRQKPKPIVVFIYTNWCKICFGMKKTTFNNKEIINLLNNHFYFVKLDGEDKNDIKLLNKEFSYKPTGSKTGIHELAKELAYIDGKVSFPTTTFLNSNFEIEAQLDSYIASKKMKLILVCRTEYRFD